MDYKTLDKDGTILGMTVFNNCYLEVYNQELGTEEKIKVSKGTILIDNNLIGNEKLLHRYRFTCSHEASHWLLHKDRFTREIEGQMSLFSDSPNYTAVKCLNRSVENAFGYKESGFMDDEDWLEWQADYMGAALLLPILPFSNEFFKLLKMLDISKKYLYFDNQTCNIKNYEIVVNQLVNTFNVSRKAVHIRLVKLNLIKGEDNQLYFA